MLKLATASFGIFFVSRGKWYISIEKTEGYFYAFVAKK